jgi:branched-chain amino acid transport system substrate-binding protein
LTDLEPKLAVILLVAGLIVGGGIGYFSAMPKGVGKTTIPNFVDQIPLKNVNIKLGYIASDTTALEVGKPYHEQIIAADLNKYAEILGYATSAYLGQVTFSYLIDDAQGQASTHLEKVQGFKSMGVTVFEGGGWSSQAQSALSYVNNNGMLMWSASSTSPTLAIADDNLFRMCPADSHLAPAMVNVMWAAGVRSIVIFQRGDSWGDGIVNLLVPLWVAKGGEISGEKVRYATNTTDFSNYLTTADQEVRDAVAKYSGDKQRVGVVILAYNEISPILRMVSDYTNMYNVHWWWSNGSTATIYRVMDDAPEVASHIGVYCLVAHVTQTPLYAQLKNRYENLTKQQFGVNQAFSYDIAMVISNSMYQMQSTDGALLVPLQKPTSDRMFGSTGSLRLDDFGDRNNPSYDIWGFYPSPTQGTVSKIIGQYNPDAEEVKEGEGTVFNPDLINPGPPGP